MNTPNLIAALPEMEPSAEKRANRLVALFQAGGIALAYNFIVCAIRNAHLEGHRDGQSSALAAVGPVIEAARELRDNIGSVECHNAGSDHAVEALMHALSSFPAAPGGMWRDIEKEKPAPHTKVLFRCDDGEIYRGSPCYGMHAPWWVAEGSLLKEQTVLNDTKIVTHWAPDFAPPSPTSTETDDGAHKK